jgi:two-component system, NtrC family, sensor kinase
MTVGFLFRRAVLIAAATALFTTTANAVITHRYSFNDGTAKDSVGKVDGNLKGAASITDGKLVLKNDDKTSDDSQLSYLEFAGPILPKTGSCTIMAWFTASEAGNFGRIVNIGDKEDAEGRAFIYFTPRNGDDLSRAAVTATDAASKTYQDNDRLDDGKPHMIALVIDGTAKKLHVFIDGKEPKPAEDLGDNTLDKVRQVNNWIGRSSFDTDAGLSASIDEFRVYDNALTADEAQAAFKAGPDSAEAAAPATQAAATK